MRRNSEKRVGAVTVLVTVSLVTIIAIVAIALDGGMLLDNRRSVQAAADAAALAAAEDLYAKWSDNQGLDVGDKAKASGLSTAAGNGYANDGVESIVTVNAAPGVYQEGPNQGNALPPGYAEVIIQFNQKRGFSSIFGSGDLPVRGRAVARGFRKKSSIGLLILNPTAQGALTITGSAGMKVDGTVIIDSSHNKAAVSTGSAALTSTQLDITGNYTSSGSSYFRADPLNTYVPPTPDFLADVPVPDPAKLPLISTSTYRAYAGETLQPGVYIGGITISSKPGVTMLPGIYYLQGGGFTMSGGSSSLTANGVMIYNGAGFNGQTGKMSITGGGALTLTPPTSGPYYGMAIFQDRTSTQTLSLSGGSAFSLTGTVYAAKAHVDVSGGSGASMGSQYVSDTLTLSGSSTFQDIVPSLGYSPRDIRLVE
jgi:hypothetical protein